jgi:hypothetical protein
MSLKSTAEQLVKSLAMRTPESQACASVHHTRILKGGLSGHMRSLSGRELAADFIGEIEDEADVVRDLFCD